MTNRHMHPRLLSTLCAAICLVISSSPMRGDDLPRKTNPSRVTPGIRQELLRVREAVWRAWFANDRAQLEKLVPEDLIAIDPDKSEWSDQKTVLENAAQFARSGGKLLSLSFPRTEIQLYGNVAILYSTYSFEVQEGDHRTTQSGRATEIFVRRNGHWQNSGWHLDSGK